MRSHVAHESLMVLAEKGQLIGATEVLQHRPGPWTSGLGRKRAERRNKSGNSYLLRIVTGLAFCDSIGHLSELAVGKCLYLKSILIQRMRTQIHSDQLFLMLQELHLILLSGQFRNLRTHRLQLFGVSEEREHTVLLPLAGMLSIFE